MEKRVIRFGAGSKENQVSQIWRLWNNKNDVYLAPSAAASNIKVSMHESGKWVTAHTKQSGLTPWEGNRRQKAWDRPKEFSKGWTQGPTIWIPHTDWMDDLTLAEKAKHDIDWVRAPKKGEELLIWPLFVDQGLFPKDIEKVTIPGDLYSLDWLQLPNKQRVTVLFRYQPITAQGKKLLTDLETQARGFKVDGKHDSMGMCITAFMQNSPAPFLAQIKLGNPHIEFSDNKK